MNVSLTFDVFERNATNLEYIDTFIEQFVKV